MESPRPPPLLCNSRACYSAAVAEGTAGDLVSSHRSLPRTDTSNKDTLCFIFAEGGTGSCPANCDHGEASRSLQAAALHICTDGRRRQIDPLVFLIPAPFAGGGSPLAGVLFSPQVQKPGSYPSQPRPGRRAGGCHRTPCSRMFCEGPVI